jgi:hypothetical protein
MDDEHAWTQTGEPQRGLGAGVAYGGWRRHRAKGAPKHARLMARDVRGLMPD